MLLGIFLVIDLAIFFYYSSKKNDLPKSKSAGVVMIKSSSTPKILLNQKPSPPPAIEIKAPMPASNLIEVDANKRIYKIKETGQLVQLILNDGKSFSNGFTVGYLGAATAK